MRTINRKQILILMMILLLSVLSLAGCGDDSVSAQPVKEVPDCAGRTVSIPEEPQRVACLYATAAHMMAMLDEGEKIAGCPNGVKSDVLMQMKYPDITKTATPHQEGSVNGEELLEIEADLAIISYSLAESDGEVEKLDKLGIPYIVIDYTSIEELKKAIGVMGEVFGKQEKADAYLAFFDDTVRLVEERLKHLPESQRQEVYHSVNEATRTDPKGGICEEIMERAGVKDISVTRGLTAEGKNVYVTLEELYNWDPETILANESSVTQYILSDSKWEGLTAVKNKRVYTLPVGATRWGHPGSMEAHMGILAIAERIYPEQFRDFDMQQYVYEYYRDYFNLKLDDRTVRKILSGEGMRAANAPE